MAHGEGTLIEICLMDGGLGGRVALPAGLHPAPGQYLAVSSPRHSAALPVILFPRAIADGWIETAPPLPDEWPIGTRLDLRGPLGHGFQLPPGARRVAIASLEDAAPERLLPLLSQALRQRAAVAVYARAIPAGLPAEVEVLPLDMLAEASAWADFLALEAGPASLPVLRTWLGWNPFQPPPCTTQVLVRTEMPCCGVASCGICAVPARSGWMQTCKDGPVFDFQQLERK